MASGDRYVVISADSHEGPPSHPEKFLPYISEKFHDEFTELTTTPPDFFSKAMFGIPLSGRTDLDPEPFRNYTMDMMALTRGRSIDWLQEMVDRYWPDGEPPGMLDPLERVASQETQGIVGEVIYTLPAAGSGPATPELRREFELAGIRWLADYCAAAPDRLKGVVSLNFEDIDRSVEDIRMAHGTGHFVAVHVPTPGTQIGGPGRPHLTEGLPTLADPHWEPLWAVCAELNMPVVIHMGTTRGPVHEYPNHDMRVWGALELLETSWNCKRQFLHLIAGKVFDQHPTLKLGLLENPIAMIPGILRESDLMIQDNGGALGLERLVSEYWYDNCFVATPFINDRDLQDLRYEIGIENVLFGSDYPQHEGTWPVTLPSLQHSFGGLPEDEIRAMLGGNAARLYGFDLDALQKIADKVGPTVEDLSKPLPREDIPPYHPGGRWAPVHVPTS